MNSINEILNSKKFQKELAEPLKNLIRRHQRETFNSEASPFSLMLQTNKTDSSDRQTTNQNTTESKKKNAA